MQLNAGTRTRKFSYVFNKKKIVKVKKKVYLLVKLKNVLYHAMQCVFLIAIISVIVFCCESEIILQF